MLQVIVASHNSTKITAARLALTQALPNTKLNIQGVSVPSGVPEQPLSDAETYQGAKQRALAARALAPNADLWIGMEGGVEFKQWQPEATTCITFAWICVLGTNFDNASRSASLTLPASVATAIQAGDTLGHAMDCLFSDNSLVKNKGKSGGGALGILTGQQVTRRGLYADTLLLALSPWLHSELYGG